MITDSKKLADIFEETTALCNKPKKVSNWLITETMRILKEKNMKCWAWGPLPFFRNTSAGK